MVVAGWRGGSVRADGYGLGERVDSKNAEKNVFKVYLILTLQYANSHPFCTETNSALHMAKVWFLYQAETSDLLYGHRHDELV